MFIFTYRRTLHAKNVIKMFSSFIGRFFVRYNNLVFPHDFALNYVKVPFDLPCLFVYFCYAITVVPIVTAVVTPVIFSVNVTCRDPSLQDKNI